MSKKTSLGLKSRNNPPSRNATSISFPRITFDLQPILDRFNTNLDEIKNHFNIADDLLAMNPPKTNEAEDIWRSQIVFLDSALDFYIHEIVKFGIIKMFNGDWCESKDYKQLKVKLKFAINLAQNPNSDSKLLEEIDEMNKYLCFMGIKKLQEQLKYISINYKLTKQEIKLLTNLYNRRNQIAHQSDFIPGKTVKQKITKEYVEDCINNIENFVNNKLHPKIASKK